MDFKMYTDNIRECYFEASDTDIIVGKAWYREARETAKNLASKHNLFTEEGLPDIWKVAGIIAVLSPQMTWKRNVTLATECIKAKKFRGHTGPNVKKATAIFEGSNPSNILGGAKVKAFYNCMVSENTDAVVVDRHALSIAIGKNATDEEQKQLFNRITMNREIQAAYREVADLVGLKPYELQAITWISWRRKKGIVD